MGRAERVNPVGYEDQVWTDNEQSRFVIWDAYMGFIEHYNNYEMYRWMGRNNKMLQAGLLRYSIYLYEELLPLSTHFSNFLTANPRNHDLSKIQEIIDESLLFEKDNLRKMRRFFNDVLFVSGIKNIIFKRDKRDGFQKLRDKYKL